MIRIARDDKEKRIEHEKWQRECEEAERRREAEKRLRERDEGKRWALLSSVEYWKKAEALPTNMCK